jgi:hypothetical protein
MKQWSEYKAEVRKPNKEEYLDGLLDVIHNQKLTTQERTDAILNAKKEAERWYQETNKKIIEESIEKADSFWLDCRAELGYDKFLSEQGCRLLEDTALLESGDLEDTYNTLKGYLYEQNEKGT